MTEEQDAGVFIQALALGIDPGWRRREAAARAADHASFAAAEAGAINEGVASELYSSIGLEPGADILLWRWANTIDALERAAARTLRSGLGAWCRVRESLIARTAPSQYARKPSGQETGLLSGERSRYLIVYPFTKATEWYLTTREERQAIMNEHMKIGRRYPAVRQALGYSFGLDDQDFVVAYETDDLAAFGDLVRELRGSESRRATVRDTPLLLGIRRTPTELGELLGV